MEILATDECEWSFDADMNLIDTFGNLVFPHMQEETGTLGNIEGSMQLQPSQGIMEYPMLPPAPLGNTTDLVEAPGSFDDLMSTADFNYEFN
jgi:hypothetical protein